MSLSELTDPAAIHQAVAEFDQLGRTAFLARYGFGRAREYMLMSSTGALYDSKAIVGAAFGIQFPDRGPMRAEDFSGGEETVERKLADLGFDVVRVGQDWSRQEVQLTVADYLDMLSLEATGATYNKSERNGRLRSRMPARSKASIELKHQNISAVLDEFGLPYIRGYKPRANVQELLREVVREMVAARPEDLVRTLDALEAIRAPNATNYAAALVEPPAGQPPSTAKRLRLPRKLDYAARDENNRHLGKSGEGWTVGFEEYRLIQMHRTDLAQRIDWVSERLGDGTGYDIGSFNDDDSARYIEVKTTNGAAQTPFVLSSNEIEFSREVGPAFFLYRVFEYGTLPRVFVLQGDLTRSLTLTPLDYRARLRAL